MALVKARSRGINLADTFAFTGTVSGDNAGNYVYLNKSTSTSTANDITFDNFTSTYNIYKIVGHWHNSSSNTTARFRLRNSSGDITSSIYRQATSRVLLTSS